MVLICGLLPKPLFFLCFVSVSLTRAFLCMVFLLNNKDTLAIRAGGVRGRRREKQKRNDLSGASVVFELLCSAETFRAVGGWWGKQRCPGRRDLGRETRAGSMAWPNTHYGLGDTEPLAVGLLPPPKSGDLGKISPCFPAPFQSSPP